IFVNGGAMIEAIAKILKKYWGYDGFLPMQARAMTCTAGGRDSIVVLPTGGGKSLCYQAPALALSGMAVVVSPLIALMKDQVDALVDCGIPAARIDSTQSPPEQRAVINQIKDRQIKMIYLSPERLGSHGFLDFLKQHDLSFIAIDEAHCISMWGHDFRPEYRQLGELKSAIEGIPIHAFTATATQEVQADIARQLNLKEPEIIVGSFDRPNLIYKVQRRRDILNQVRSVLDRHPGESGIIYCIRRRDVEEMCSNLNEHGYKVAPYHAGMENEHRKKNQDAFINEQVGIIAATIAFGMGIDKSNIRYVIHAGMPKSLEHYQQESGRAGRDGLEAECCLFYSGGDYGTWKSILKDTPPEVIEITMAKLNAMYDFCTGVTCRHKAILTYFGQEYLKDNCAACDVCLGDLDTVKDALIIAQKILSCILRLHERFGGDYTAAVLTGSCDQRILEYGHNQLSTYALLSDYPKRIVRDWIEQLAAQGFILKTGDYNTLQVTQNGRQVLNGSQTPHLLQPSTKKTKVSKAHLDSWEGVDRELFERLRALRSSIATKKGMPAYIVFGDSSIRDMARRRPGNRESFLMVHGVGEKKCDQYGELFLNAIRDYDKINSSDDE
ncbi:MAG: DNA helicase RecQ, partial [Sedimentisphaerales bacterium]|nr:DNA helicase RecQ [Sedimentisphaerales bacterium]